MRINSGKTVYLNLDLDKECKRCHKPGALDSGYCMGCIAEMIRNGELDHILRKFRKPLITK